MFPAPEENRLCYTDVEFPQDSSAAASEADFDHLRVLSLVVSLNPHHHCRAAVRVGVRCKNGPCGVWKQHVVLASLARW